LDVCRLLPTRKETRIWLPNSKQETARVSQKFKPPQPPLGRRQKSATKWRDSTQGIRRVCPKKRKRFREGTGRQGGEAGLCGGPNSGGVQGAVASGGPAFAFSSGRGKEKEKRIRVDQADAVKVLLERNVISTEARGRRCVCRAGAKACSPRNQATKSMACPPNWRNGKGNSISSR